MLIRLLFSIALLAMLCPFAGADDNAPNTREIEVVKTTLPIFGQLVMFSFPKGFVPIFQDANGAQYIQEYVVDGETIHQWSQMVTVTGAKGLAANPGITPQDFVKGIAGGFKRTCPTSFGGIGLGAIELDGHDAFAAVVSCGLVNPTSKVYSEAMLLLVIKGKSDYYTIQWAERGAASMSPLRFDSAKWTERLNTLTPIKLCPVVPGESTPFPSCGKRP